MEWKHIRSARWLRFLFKHFASWSTRDVLSSKINTWNEKHIDRFFIVRSSNCTTSWSRLKGFARSKAIGRRVSLTRLFTVEGGIPSKEILVERSSLSRITSLIKFIAGKTDYSSCINVFLSFKKSHDISFIEILEKNLSARFFIASSKSRIFPCRKFYTKMLEGTKSQI